MELGRWSHNEEETGNDLITRTAGGSGVFHKLDAVADVGAQMGAGDESEVLVGQRRHRWINIDAIYVGAGKLVVQVGAQRAATEAQHEHLRRRQLSVETLLPVRFHHDVMMLAG